MVSLTISLDEKTYEAVKMYKENNLLDNTSQAIRMLVKKGIAHELEVRAKIAHEKEKK